MITVIGAPSQRSRLEAAAREASATGLSVELEHPPRWSWAPEQTARVTVSEAGGCACSFLTDEADWDAEVWTMRPEVLDRLARTLELLVALDPEGLAIEALWTGTTPQRTVLVSSAELGSLVRSSRLGTRTRYEVQRRT